MSTGVCLRFPHDNNNPFLQCICLAAKSTGLMSQATPGKLSFSFGIKALLNACNKTLIEMHCLIKIRHMMIP